MLADPDCKNCQGTGWKQVVRGGVEAVERCDCAPPAAEAERFARTNLPPRFRDTDFGTFEPIPQAENPIQYRNQMAAMIAARTFADEYPFGEKKGLLLLGPPGVGKTHLAAAALKSLVERGFDGVFFDYPSLLQKIRDGYDPTAGASDRAAYRMALDCEILLLDDLGTHRATDWVYDTVQTIINHRYNENKAIVATTNLPVVEFGDPVREKDAATGQYRIHDSLADRIGGRAVSRLIEMCRIVRIQTEDYRLRGTGRR